MEDLKVWDKAPVPLPAGKTAVDGKFVFAPKLDAEGNVVRYRARFVARGFTQRPGSDYTETFSSVVKWATVRMVGALAAVNDWEVHVVDVKTAFLRAPLEEEVYLRQPAELSDGTNRVLRLRQALYGLKQAPRAWEQELGKFLVGQGFKRCTSDRALYVKSIPGGILIVPVYVDDLMVTGTPPAAIQAFKAELRKAYETQDLGPISTYLGVQVVRDRQQKTLALGLPKYISTLEKRFQQQLGSTGGASSPMVPDTMKLMRKPMECWSPEQRAPASRELYMRLMGSLMYAAITCRPDLAFSVSFLSQWSTDPKELHLECLIRVLRYLVRTKGAQLVYQGKGASVQPCVYTDSDWGSDSDGLSRAGWTAKLAGGAISWYSKKLQLTATSSAEAEYKALSEGAKEAMWLHNIMGELGIQLKCTKLFCDNESALNMSKNPVQHHKSRHFQLSWHFVRQVQEAGHVEVHHVRTALQDADVLTKALPARVHLQAVGRLGLVVPETKIKTKT